MQDKGGALMSSTRSARLGAVVSLLNKAHVGVYACVVQAGLVRRYAPLRLEE